MNKIPKNKRGGAAINPVTQRKFNMGALKAVWKSRLGYDIALVRSKTNRSGVQVYD